MALNGDTTIRAPTVMDELVVEVRRRNAQQYYSGFAAL
jgi:hypothetical protein